MRFSGERHVPAPVAQVWAGLHDDEVLRSTIPGCEDLVSIDGGRYVATLAARVGPVADTYRGTFSIEDLRPGSELRVGVGARGRCGRLEVSLHVTLTPGQWPGTTTLGYDAETAVTGLVSRLGRTPLIVAGGHFTGCFFRGLERSLGRGAAVDRLAPSA